MGNKLKKRSKINKVNRRHTRSSNKKYRKKTKRVNKTKRNKNQNGGAINVVIGGHSPHGGWLIPEMFNLTQGEIDAFTSLGYKAFPCN
jgi:predicted alpha/beta-hydrolase family hydrolase